MQDLIEKMRVNMSSSQQQSNFQNYAQMHQQNGSSNLTSFGQSRTLNTNSTTNNGPLNMKQAFIVPSNQTLSRITANLNANYEQNASRQASTNGSNIINNSNNNNNNNNNHLHLSYLTNSTSI